MPDARTVWLYRAAKAGKAEVVFALFDGHLARQGHIVRGGRILDAVNVDRKHKLMRRSSAHCQL